MGSQDHVLDRAGLDVYVYCDNDMKVRAPYDAMGLMERLGLAPARPTVSPHKATNEGLVAEFVSFRGLVRRNAAVPRVPERAHLPLLPSSPGGVG